MSKEIRNEIWVLADNRPGTASQAIGLAKELQLPTKIFQLHYSPLVALPNFFLKSSLLRLAKSCREEIEAMPYLPNLVISAGRRAAPIALAIKKISKSDSRIIQIMNPNTSFHGNFSAFDLVVLPKHDGIDEARFNNVATTIGSLTRIDENLLQDELKKFSFTKSEKPKIALLIGGTSKNTLFTAASAAKLVQAASQIAKNMNAELLALNSRRSGVHITKILRDELCGNYQFFDWDEVKNNNPYLAILAAADFFIISGDSVSMISEACSTGKPVYIFDEERISSEKHRKFHDELCSKNYATKLVDSVTSLKNFSSNRLEETKRISSIIREKFVVGKSPQ